MATDSTEEKRSTFFTLSRKQRRVLGVMIEKAFTTPEYYPLTPKAITTGCNQKSNRDPVVNYSEDDVLDTLQELRELKLAACVHTDGGRVERYRHYMRHVFEITEPQLAIMGELLLRGRQQLGELRSRASRMVSIESLDQLRDELTGLLVMRGVQFSGDLNRRGVEVDHALYEERENVPAMESIPESSAEETSTPTPSVSPAPKADSSQLDALRDENRELREELERVRDDLDSLRSEFDDFRTQLGG